MAKEPGTELPAADPADDAAAESDLASSHDAAAGPDEDIQDGPTDGGWTAESAGRGHGEPVVTEQVRRTDADRWAASFSAPAAAPEPLSRARNEPVWSGRIPVPPGEPSWRTDAGSGSGWGQVASPAPAAAQPPPAEPARPWTTDVPSGFSWGPDSNAPATPPRPPQGRIDADHALPTNRPPPPPTGYPGQSATHQVATHEPQGNRQPGGTPYGGGQAGQHAPGSQSRWAAAQTTVTPEAPTAAPPPQQWQPADGQQGWQPGGQQLPSAPVHSSAADLTSGSLVKPAAAVPRVGWRKMVHAVTGGAVNPGLSQAEMHRRNLIERATAPVRGCHRIAIVSLKGGIGKTTTTAGLGLTLAEHRGDRVVALDANPDAGTLAERLTGQVDVTVRDLLDTLESIRSFTDVSAFTSLAARLQVLASEQDPEMSEAFSEAEYCTVADVLARYFNIVLTDSGTGLLHSAMSGTLAIADSLVVVGSPSVDGASRASKTLDWLIAHGRGELVSRAVAVISTVRPATKELDMARLREHFQARVRAVVEIPYDRHLVTGGIIDMTQLDDPTEQAFLELAATVADGFRLPPLVRTKQ